MSEAMELRASESDAESSAFMAVEAHPRFREAMHEYMAFQAAMIPSCTGVASPDQISWFVLLPAFCWLACEHMISLPPSLSVSSFHLSCPVSRAHALPLVLTLFFFRVLPRDLSPSVPLSPSLPLRANVLSVKSQKPEDILQEQILARTAWTKGRVAQKLPHRQKEETRRQKRQPIVSKAVGARSEAKSTTTNNLMMLSILLLRCDIK